MHKGRPVGPEVGGWALMWDSCGKDGATLNRKDKGASEVPSG